MYQSNAILLDDGDLFMLASMSSFRVKADERMLQRHVNFDGLKKGSRGFPGLRPAFAFPFLEGPPSLPAAYPLPASEASPLSAHEVQYKT